MEKNLSNKSLSKKYTKYIKIAIWILAMVIAVGIIGRVLNYLYFPTDVWHRIVWHSFYNQEQIDNVYIGSSHVYCDIDPFMLDKLNGEMNFDLSTSSQSIEQSYFNLMEASRLYDIKKVFVELYYMPSTGKQGDYSDVIAIQNGWRDIDYMSKLSNVRYEGIINMNDSKHLLDAIFPTIRYRNYLFDWNHIINNIDTKNMDEYKLYQHTQIHSDENGKDYYKEKGWFESDRVLIKNDIYNGSDTLPEHMMITPDAQKYLIKIIDYCRKNEIQLTLFISPIWENQLLSTENYDSYHNSVKAIAEEYQVPFYDFNLIKLEYMNLRDTNAWRDVGHLNTKGAHIYTPVFYDVVSGKYANTDELFYDSFEERMRSIEPYMYGIYRRNPVTDKNNREEFIKKNEIKSLRTKIKEGFIEPYENGDVDSDEDNRDYWVIAATSNLGMEFRVVFTRDEDDDDEETIYDTPKQRMYQDFSENRIINLPEDEHGICTVVWRIHSEPDKVEIMDFEY